MHRKEIARMATINFKTDKGSEFNLEMNTERHEKGGYLHVRAGGRAHNAATAVFEADRGYVILGFLPRIASQWGESGYTTRLIGRESHVEKVEKINEAIDQLVKQSEQKDNKSINEML